MLTMDIFKDDAFSATSMLTAVSKVGYTPGFIGSIPGLFDPVPVRTTSIWIEEQSDGPALIQTSPRGSAPTQKVGIGRSAKSFNTLRLAKASRITASELAGIREFGSETELKQLMKEIALRQQRMKNDMDLTFEYWKLACLQGFVNDADGTELINWATELGQTIPSEVDFDLDNASPVSGILRKRCTTAVRTMTRALKGQGGNGVRFMALCGDAFWDDLMAHPEIRALYLQTADAKALANPMAWESFYFAGITFVNYRGTDDGSTVAIHTDKAKFFPVGAGIFKWAMSPGESFAELNQPGQAFTSLIVTDKDRDQWADIEMYAYPLPVCTMPQALYQARRT